MSAWRREASKRLPELQPLISSRNVDNPMMLWIELRQRFSELCERTPLPLDQLKRIWGYCEWCLESKSQDVMTAAALGFVEHLIDTSGTIAALPRIMSKSRFAECESLVTYHSDESKFREVLLSFPS